MSDNEYVGDVTDGSEEDCGYCGGPCQNPCDNCEERCDTECGCRSEDDPI